MLIIRLQRRGKRNFVTYRVVVADRRAPIHGRFIADLGAYNPHTDQFDVDKSEVDRWLKQGAQPSDTVHNLLVTAGMITGPKRVLWRPRPSAAPAEAAAKSEAPTEAPSANSADASQ